MLVVGLTGSIGMGKSTTAAMFRAHGVPVHDADAAVHRLYAGEATAAIDAAFPGVAADGVVDRGRLAQAVIADPAALRRLEDIVHPLVRASEATFLAAVHALRQPLALIDVPLLFETGRAGELDAVVVATAEREVQRRRVLARPAMTAEKLDALLARQMPDDEKRRRAHFLVETGGGIANAERQVRAILRALAYAA